MSKQRVLIAGESWVTHSIHQKGFDSFTTTAYEEAYGAANSFQLAELYGFVGDADPAFKWLDSALEVHDPGMSWVSTSEFLRPLHDDPRWAQVVERAGF